MRPRFVADANVGKLARWLRIMGYDALFPGTADESRCDATARDMATPR